MLSKVIFISVLICILLTYLRLFKQQKKVSDYPNVVEITHYDYQKKIDDNVLCYYFEKVSKNDFFQLNKQMYRWKHIKNEIKIFKNDDVSIISIETKLPKISVSHLFKNKKHYGDVMQMNLLEISNEDINYLYLIFNTNDLPDEIHVFTQFNATSIKTLRYMKKDNCWRIA